MPWVGLFNEVVAFPGHTHLPFGFPVASPANIFCELDIRFYDAVHDHRTTEYIDVFLTGKNLAHKVMCKMPKSFNNYVINLPALNWLLYGNKQCKSLYKIRYEEAMKKVLPKCYHRTDNSLTMHVMNCCYQLHVLILKTWIILQLQSLGMNPMRKHMAEWH